MVQSDYEAEIDVIGSVEGIDALNYIKKAEIWSGDTVSLINWQTLKDRASLIAP